ncbi:hypothetical protein Fmac_027637 [Flemingia macrophylla]|uniref:Uncharacterized protein n=1 Tax=Flemingia macrophylla TaxID=520843 RepID=A0ABD1LII1_9FABA
MMASSIVITIGLQHDWLLEEGSDGRLVTEFLNSLFIDGLQSRRIRRLGWENDWCRSHLHPRT